jgi:release factor glutamine methyltransferase
MGVSSYIFHSKMTLQDALQHCLQQGFPRVEAQMLLLHVLGRATHERAWLLTHDADTLTAAQASALQVAAQRRLNGEPVAYIVGHKEFFGLALAVDARVLDPRDDTETLVEWALEVLSPHAKARVVDLGTGSGAIGLALQHSRPTLQVHAIDYSADALAVAQANAQRLGLAVTFSQGSWLTGITERFHAIVSNPPYIAAHDPHLAALTHEPLQALASGVDGLDDIRTIVSQAPTRLHTGGWLLLEHGYHQAAAVRALLHAHGFVDVQSRHDLAGIERCSGGRLPA